MPLPVSPWMSTGLSARAHALAPARRSRADGGAACPGRDRRARARRARASGRAGAGARAAGLEQPLAAPPRSAGSSTGLVRNCSAPSFTACTARSIEPWPVSTTSGTAASSVLAAAAAARARCRRAACSRARPRPGARLRKRLRGLGRLAASSTSKPLRLEEVAHAEAHARLVVHEQHAVVRVMGQRASGRPPDAGQRAARVTTAPPSGWLRGARCGRRAPPRCAATMDRPRPVPPRRC